MTALRIVAVSSFESSHLRSRMKTISKSGHNVNLILPSNQTTDSEFSPRKDASIIKFKPFQIFYEYYLFLKKIKSLNPDIIHIHYAGGPYAALATLFIKPVIIVSVMGGDVLPDEQPQPSWAMKELSKIILLSADKITAKSNYLINMLKNFKLTDDHPTRILWGVDLEKFNPHVETKDLRHKLNLNESLKIIFCPKAVQPIYNIDSLIKAFSVSLKSHSNSFLLICKGAADPEYLSQIEKLITELKLSSQVLLLDKISHNEMPSYYAISDIVISIPDSDGLPQSLFEAMACGKPSIVSKLSRYSEITSHNVESLWVNPKDINEISHALNTLLSDSSFYKELSENCIIKARTELSTSNSTSSILKLYNNVLPQNSIKRTLITYLRRILVIDLLTIHFIEILVKRILGIKTQ